MHFPFVSGISEGDGLLPAVPFGREKPEPGSEQLDFSLMNQLYTDYALFSCDFRRKEFEFDCCHRVVFIDMSS
jgi:hypothetical protein